MTTSSSARVLPGAVLAERLASQLNRRCLIVDRRPTTSRGNAYDFYDKAGVLLHQYGPHYFRTNSERIRAYLGQFTEWVPAELQGVELDGRALLAISHQPEYVRANPRARPSSSEEMAATLEKWRVPIERPAQFGGGHRLAGRTGRCTRNSSKNYTRKQWRRDPSELDRGRLWAHVPIRTNRDDRYVSDRFQEMPRDGLHGDVRADAGPPEHRGAHCARATARRGRRCHTSIVVYTGPVDEYFDHCHGPLPYRSLRFEAQTLETEWFQPAVQVNYPNDQEFTRIVEIKHVTGQTLPATTIVREYPQDYGPGGEAYYPMPAPDARALYRKYEEMAETEANVTFVGRMATYRYYNMDQVVAMSLAEFDRIAAAKTTGP